MKYSTVLAFAGLAAAAPAKVSRQDPGGEMNILPIPEPTSGKKGISWAPHLGALHPDLAKNSGWVYTWDDPVQLQNLHSVPMCWGSQDARCKVQQIANHISQTEEKWVLGYNEPDVRGGGGSDITPENAFTRWEAQMLPLKENHNAKLICPGISSENTDKGHSTGTAAGLHWLDEFVRFAPNPAALRCDAQAVHWYGLPGQGSAADRAEAFTDYLELAHEHVNQLFSVNGRPANMKLWVTEYGPEPGDAVDRQLLADFLTIVIPWMNDQPWIERHSAFMASLMRDGPDGPLNVAGHAFINA